MSLVLPSNSRTSKKTEPIRRRGLFQYRKCRGLGRPMPIRRLKSVRRKVSAGEDRLPRLGDTAAREMAMASPAVRPPAYARAGRKQESVPSGTKPQCSAVKVKG